MYTKSAAIRKFDFEIGYLVKSPCKGCYLHSLSFPSCADSCKELDRIQTILAPTITCTRSNSSVDADLLSFQEGE